MCIIIYKPKNKRLPDKETLETCFKNNPDGAGFMYAEKGNVIIKKGYMSFTRFYEELQKVISKHGQDIPYVLHFRIGTQGANCEELTHPYPLSREMKDLKKLNTKSSIGIAHNGIIDLTTSCAKKVDYNDTMKFITDYLSLIIHGLKYYKEPDTLKLIERLCESKLAILDKTGHCELIGEGWQKDNGIYYSNSSYLPSLSRYAYGWYDYDDCNYDELYEYDYDEKAGLYDFDAYDCPATTEGDCSFCSVCKSQLKCWYDIDTTKGEEIYA